MENIAIMGELDSEENFEVIEESLENESHEFETGNEFKEVLGKHGLHSTVQYVAIK